MADLPLEFHPEARASDGSGEPIVSAADVEGVEAPPVRLQQQIEEPPASWRELLALLLMVALCDATVYRGQGFCGYALLLAAAPALLLLGSPRPSGLAGFVLVSLMLAAAAAKLVWCGSWLLAACGLALLAAVAMILSGLRPYVLELIVFVSQTVLAGYLGLQRHWRRLRGVSPPMPRAAWLSVILPAAALIGFGALFVLANPDLLAWLGEGWRLFLEKLHDWVARFAPTPLEVLFWIAVFWTTLGLLRPVVGRSMLAETSGHASKAGKAEKPSPAPLYAAFRNTLVTVIGLFAVYLAFEFNTLWFLVFPPGFYYSGYAHEGAAWLTAALGLATLVLSLVFQGSMLHDPRLPKLRRLAWIWSLENVLLAIAVYHRLSIYVGFNGMTRMRIVGVFGVTTVLAGFVLVLWKIARNRSFIWLIRYHLWALALAVYLFVLTPVDTIWVSYNVRRILSGDPAPSVQISRHPIDSEGILLLQPLLEGSDERIREGVRAMLAERHERAEATVKRRREQGWTSYQMADRVVLDRLDAARAKWRRYAGRGQREAVLQRFHDYAYQWW